MGIAATSRLSSGDGGANYMDRMFSQSVCVMGTDSDRFGSSLPEILKNEPVLVVQSYRMKRGLVLSLSTQFLKVSAWR